MVRPVRRSIQAGPAQDGAASGGRRERHGLSAERKILGGRPSNDSDIVEGNENAGSNHNDGDAAKQVIQC